MEFLVIWIASVITSYGISFTNILQVLKMAADLGYRVDYKKMKRVLALVYNNIIVAFPIFNVLCATKELFNYSNCIGLLDKFRILELVDHMTPNEQETYKRNATGLNAYKIAKRHEKSLENASFVFLKGGSMIYYKLKSAEECLKSLNILDSIIILQADGYAKNLSLKEQKQIVLDIHRDSIEEKFEKYIMSNLDFNSLINSESCDLNKDCEKSVTIEERIEGLKNLKNEISSTNIGNEEIDNKKVKTLK